MQLRSTAFAVVQISATATRDGAFYGDASPSVDVVFNRVKCKSLSYLWTKSLVALRHSADLSRDRVFKKASLISHIDLLYRR